MSSKLIPQNSIPRNFQRTISRRSILRGAGVAMALPFLESLPAFGAATSSAFPKRFAVVFMGCGINEDHWSSEGDGAAMKLGKTLSPLEPLKQKINVIDGLYVKELQGQGIHPAQTGSIGRPDEYRRRTVSVLDGARLEDLRRRVVARGRVADVHADRVHDLLGAQVPGRVREEATEVDDDRVVLLAEGDVAVDRGRGRREEDVRVVAHGLVEGRAHERERLVRLHVRERVRRQAVDPDAMRNGAGDGHVA